MNPDIEYMVADFISWRDSLRKQTRGCKVMFDVPTHYKWIDESQIFTYWLNNITMKKF